MRETSLLAWMEIRPELSEMQSIVYAALKNYGSCTHNELAYKLAQEGIIFQNHKENVRKRCGDLERAGYIVPDITVTCSITRRQAISWRVR